MVNWPLVLKHGFVNCTNPAKSNATTITNEKIQIRLLRESTTKVQADKQSCSTERERNKTL